MGKERDKMKHHWILRIATLTLCVLLALIPLAANAAPSTTAEVDEAIAKLKNTYKEGDTWTGPFTDGGVSYAAQCFGFACLLGRELFGQNPYKGGWTKHYAAKEFLVGDIIRLRRVSSSGVIKNYNHAYFVYEIKGDTVCLADCNRAGVDKVSWKMTLSVTELARRVAMKQYVNEKSDENKDTPTGYVWRYDDNPYVLAEHHPAHPVFYDVPQGAWYYDAVDYTWQNGIFNGQTGGSFAPENDITRAMFVQVLCNLSGAAPSKKDQCPFTDVPKNAWYYAAVCWAKKSGVVEGTSAMEFSPDRAITRQEMCVILYGYARLTGAPPKDAAPDFSDADEIAKWAKTAVGACQNAGWIGGVGGGKFAPLMTASRAQAAQILTVYDKTWGMAIA